MKPLVSIIIPTFNRAHLIGETIDSILQQTFQNWECIIVDDGSSDATEEIVLVFSMKNPAIKYYRRPANLPKGPSACRNYGFSFAKGDFIHFMDSDDLYLPNALETYEKSFSELIDVVVAKLALTDFDSGLIIKENQIESKNLLEDYFIGKVAFYVSGPLWRKSFLLKQEALFDENISNLDDWDFNLRMILQNPKVSYLNEVIIQYRFHQDSLSQEIHKFNFAEIQSEISAREKILMILKEHRGINLSVVINFYTKRCQLFLKEALLQKHSKKYYLLFKTMNLQILNYHFFSAVKTIFGFVVYTVFGKGYKFIKP